MNESSNIWDKSAALYAQLNPEISFYKKTSSYLFEFGEIQDCNSMVDLGCGSSGLTANKALTKFPSLKELYCIDSSEEMIQECTRNVTSDKVIFVQKDAKNFHTSLRQQTELVMVNSAFWLFNTSLSLKSIYSSLMQSGHLIFNLSEWDYEFSNYEIHPKYVAIDIQLKKRNIQLQKSRGSKEKISARKLNNYFEKYNFKVRKTEVINIEVEREDWLKFYSIPTIINRSLPNLDVNLGMEILSEAIHSLSDNEFPPVKWIFYKVEKIIR